MSRLESASSVYDDPVVVAARLEWACGEVLRDTTLPPDARKEIARRTRSILMDHLEQYPELQEQQSADAFTMIF